ncbi:MAG: S1 RNA-binding domain-containing protein [Nanoarchaeota archaeon]|nr:S1 RNA-binding domain-containing protein [Nanoarchaeota archaeon]
MVFYKKTGFPKEGDIILCKVKKILPHSVFADLIEYDNKEGMIHISEISSRWTKNINDVVSVGKLIVCKVEKINEEKGYIDLSKKRVTSGQEKNKKDEIKNENRIEKLIEYACQKNKLTLKDFYEKTGYTILEDYGSLFDFYENFKEDESVINDLELAQNVKEDIKKAFESMVQKSRVTVKKPVKFYAEGSNGLKDLKDFIKEVKKSVKEEDNDFSIIYINSPEYLASVNSKNYKEANNFLEKLLKVMKDLSKDFNVNLIE